MTVEHRACAWRGRSDGRGIKKERYEAQLAREERSNKNRGILRLERATVAGAWITVVPYLLNGATFSAEDFRDNLRIGFRMLPLYLQQTCDRCGDTLTVEHDLQCKRGVLVTVRHNDVAADRALSTLIIHNCEC